MAVTLELRNYENDGSEQTQLSSAVAIAGTTLTVDSTQGFTASEYVILGTEGTESCEIVKITSVDTDIQLTVDATKFAHIIDDLVTFIPFNQIRIYDCATQTGIYGLITSVSMDVENARKSTIYSHQSGTTSTWYKYTFYNSTTATETDIVDSTAVLGTYTYYCSVRDVANYLGVTIDDTTSPNSQTVLDMIESVCEEIDSTLNTSFKVNTISDTAYEYHDGLGGKNTIEGEVLYQTKYFLKHTPIISITTLGITTNPDTTDAAATTWNALTENTDYYLDNDTGRIDIVTSSYAPPKGNKRIRVAYTWGRSSIPADVRKMTVMMVVRDLMKSTVGKSLMMGRDEFKTEHYNALNDDIERIQNKYLEYKMCVI